MANILFLVVTEWDSVSTSKLVVRGRGLETMAAVGSHGMCVTWGRDLLLPAAGAAAGDRAEQGLPPTGLVLLVWPLRVGALLSSSHAPQRQPSQKRAECTPASRTRDTSLPLSLVVGSRVSAQQE